MLLKSQVIEKNIFCSHFITKNISNLYIIRRLMKRKVSLIPRNIFCTFSLSNFIAKTETKKILIQLNRLELKQSFDILSRKIIEFYHSIEIFLKL
jgi:hypothetical protein